MSSDKSIETEKDMRQKITVLTLCAMLFALCGSVDAFLTDTDEIAKGSVSSRLEVS